MGTFPPTKKNWSYDFFYPNKANLFWRILAAISGKQLEHFSGNEAVDERKDILNNLKITITDMGKRIARMDNSSLDENLVPLEYMNIGQILTEKPLINKIIFTSSSGKASAAKWFENFLGGHNINHKFTKGPRPIKSILHLDNRMLSLVILYSPSPRAANRISFDKLVQLYEAEI